MSRTPRDRRLRVCVAQLDGVNTMNALPLAAGQLVATARLDPLLAAHYRFDIVVGNEPVDELVESLRAPDVLALSIYLWNEQYALALARAMRAANPGCLIVAGGPCVPRRPEAARAYLQTKEAIDVLVRGEGEPAFCELLHAHREESDIGGIDGIAYRDGRGKPVATTPRPRVADLSETGSPYLDGTFDRLCARYPGRYPNPIATALIETNRGCPFRCTFCAAGLVEQNRVYEVPLDRVRRELDWIVARRFNYLFIADANFGIRPRDPQIVGHLAELKARTGRPGYCFFYMTKNARERNLATVETLRAAGIGCQVALSTQSFDTSVLAAVKRANIPAERWLRLRDICNDRGIATYNELILGLPEQTYDSFAETVVKAISPLPRDTFYLYLCRAIPNTDMDEPHYRRRYALETRMCRSVSPEARTRPVVDEYEEIIVGTASMPVAEWRRAFTLGYLVCALYNQRLLDVVIYYLQTTLGVDLRRYFQALVAAIGAAADGSVLAEFGRAFERYLTSILSGEPVLLPVDGAGSSNREVNDAVVRVALERPSDFLAEMADFTRRFLATDGVEDARTEELFRFQALLTPQFGSALARQARFEHDWLTYWRRERVQPEPAASPTSVSFTPPTYAEADRFERFIDAHLASIRAKGSTGALAAAP